MSLADLLANPFFSGIVGATALGYLGFLAKDLPKKAWGAVKQGFTCELSVFSSDSAFDRVSEWLAAQQAWGRVRQYRISHKFDEASRQERYAPAPGMGWHVVKFQGRLLFVHRHEPNGPTATTGPGYSPRRNENIDIWTVGRSNAAIRKVLESIGENTGEDVHQLRVFTYRQGWRLSCRKAKRALESVVLPAGQKQRIVGDIADFLVAREWHADRGVPYRRGYLLEGPPGCGKTSLVLAVASHFSRPVYVLNLGSILSDDDLIDAVGDVPEHAIFLIEDIDATKASAVRKEAPKPGEYAGGDINLVAREVTLSALLNCIDGAFAREGRILFMTTNHPDKIDPALLRPGRVDLREYVGALGLAEVAELCGRFFANPREAVRFINAVKTPIAAAELQEKLVQATRSMVTMAAE